MAKPLKILFVRPTLGYGGADRVTLNLLLGFNREAYHCDLALMKAEGEFIQDLPQDVHVFDLKARSLWSMWRPLLKVIKNSHYDIVYSTCGGASMPMMLAVWLGRFKGISIVSERNILFPPKKSRLKRSLMIAIKAFLFKKASWVTAVSKGVAQECQTILGVPSERVKVVNNPIINSSLIQGAKESVDHPFFSKHDNVILAVGRFEWQKDYDTLINAFHVLSSQRSDTGLFILGKGPLKGYYEQRIKALDLEDRVCFAGFDKNPFKYMANCSVYVLSSRHEGMPGTLVQAMACGAACVSTDCKTGPNELIENGENGFLVSVGDFYEMNQKIGALLQKDSLRLKFRKNAPEAIKAYNESEGIASYFSFISPS